MSWGCCRPVFTFHAFVGITKRRIINAALTLENYLDRCGLTVAQQQTLCMCVKGEESNKMMLFLKHLRSGGYQMARWGFRVIVDYKTRNSEIIQLLKLRLKDG